MSRASLREPSKLVYRAIRDAAEVGLELSEIADRTGLEKSRVLACLIWIRSTGVDVRALRAPGAYSRFALGSALPDALEVLV